MRSIILFYCAVLALASEKSYDGYKVFSIKLENTEQLMAIRSLERLGVHPWEGLNINIRPTRVMVPKQSLTHFEDLVQELNIQSKLTIDNLSKAPAKEKQENDQARSLSRKRSNYDFDYYLRFDEIKNHLLELAESYPHLVNVTTAGQSYEGRDMLLVKISNSGFDGTKPVIFIDAGIHAREWIAPMAILYLISQIVTNSDLYADMLEVDWMIVPMVNPDGYEYSHTHDRIWRKTRKPIKGSPCIGTDGNRNYPFQWEPKPPIPINICNFDEEYPGDKPVDQPEVKTIVDLLSANSDNIKLYLSVHSYGDLILYPYGYGEGIYNPHTNQLKDLGDRVANAIQKEYPLRVYTTQNVATQYVSKGLSIDYAAGAQNITLSYVLELSSGEESYEFELPPSQIRNVSSEIFVGFHEYAKYISEIF